MGQNEKQFYHGVSENSGNTNEPPVNPDPQHLVWIKPGTFTMGSPSNEQNHQKTEWPQTQVTISRGFWMSKYEATQEQYQSVMGTNPSPIKGLFHLLGQFAASVMGTNPSHFKGDINRPVENVTWNYATAYCGKLTVRERAAGRLPARYVYRLPTEAEWEYACRAGTTTATAFGNSLSSAQANFNGNYPYGRAIAGPYLERTTAVGSYAPNAWGLYDMHGNVGEWCLDWFGLYPGGRVTDPQGPASGSLRVLRGGGWRCQGWACRSAIRCSFCPDDRFEFLGFRSVLVQGQ
jgi:formylglycine-generating enzyme required for sulfatase activity